MPRQSRADREAASRAIASFKGGGTRTPHDYSESPWMDIRLAYDGTPILFTVYKGHAFHGWIVLATFVRMEEDGVLSWDADGNPAIDESKARPPSVDRGPAWIGAGI